MIAIECASCGVVFGITETYHAKRKEYHDEFRCPNGHTNVYPAPKVTPEQQEIEQLQGNLAESSRIYRELHVTLEDWKRAARICPICEERVTTAQYIETIRAKVAEHLRDEHGARARLRAITERATA